MSYLDKYCIILSLQLRLSMLFASIPGLADVKNVLINAVKNNHVAHAQLFLGHLGSANLSMALAFATYLNCEDKQSEDACGKCASCTKMNKFIHPDLHFLFPTTTKDSKDKDATKAKSLADWRLFLGEKVYGSANDWVAYLNADNKQLSINVEDARTLASGLSLKAYEGEYKVVILWLPEYMNAASANMLLKTLEEPPDKTVFLLITQDIEKILLTILSRTQLVYIPDFNETDIEQYVLNKYRFESKKASQLSFLANGSIYEVERLASEVEDDNQVIFRDWMRLCFKKDHKGLLDFSELFQKLGREAQKSLFSFGLNVIREAMVYSNSGTSFLRLRDEGLEFIKGFSKVINDDNVEKLIKELSEANYHIERNANPKILFLDISLRISGYFRK